jgi:hypothetical protein
VTNGVSPAAAALANCYTCGGLGVRLDKRLCPCVYRQVFRACIKRYRQLRAGDSSVLRADVERVGAGTRRTLTAGFKRVEYMADLETTARRALESCNPLWWAVWLSHYLQNQPWKTAIWSVGRKVGRRIDRAEFFAAAYIIEERLGRLWMELQPHSMWPRCYFSGRHLEVDNLAIPTAELGTSAKRTARELEKKAVNEKARFQYGWRKQGWGCHTPPAHHPWRNLHNQEAQLAAAA